MRAILHGIAELPTYAREADRLLSEKERQELIDYLAEHPQEGEIMASTGEYANRVGVVAQGKSGASASFTTNQSRWKARTRWTGFQREITPKIVSNSK
jgi:hypothetical protein